MVLIRGETGRDAQGHLVVEYSPGSSPSPRIIFNGWNGRRGPQLSSTFHPPHGSSFLVAVSCWSSFEYRHDSVWKLDSGRLEMTLLGDITHMNCRGKYAT